MNYSIWSVSKLYNIQLEEKYRNLQISNKYMISNDILLFDKIFHKDEFVKGIGTIQYHDYSISNLLYRKVHDIKMFEDGGLPLLTEMSMDIQDFITCLWMVRDNGVTFEDAFLFMEVEGKSTSTILNKSLLWTNSCGTNDCELFSNKEIELAMTYYKNFDRFYGVMWPEELQKTARVHSQQHEDFHLFFNRHATRIQRFLFQLHNARTENFMPSRLAAYSTCLEAIVSTAKDNIKHNTSYRTANLLKDVFDKDNTIKVIKEAYNIRSYYLHGSKIGDKFGASDYRRIKDTSKKMDDILRKVLLKIYHDKKLRYMYYSDDIKEIDEYFDRIE